MTEGSHRGSGAAQQSGSGDYIAEDAPHWDAESFIPVTVSELKSELLARTGNDDRSRDELDRVFESLTSILNHDYRNLHQQLETHYSVLDPDRDLKLLEPPNRKQLKSSLGHMRGYLDDVLCKANFTRLDHDQIRSAMHGASHWGVRLQADFDIFESLDVYVRGDVVGMRSVRLWNSYWRMSEVEVPIYQRLVAIYKLSTEAKIARDRFGGDLDRERLHLSLFKNIPQADVDMLLPGSNIRFSWLDRTKIFAPTLGGLGMTLFKIFRGAVVIAATGLAAVFGVAVLAVGIIGYAARSVFSYFHTKDKYLLNMTRSLYFQKLDCNAGAIYRLLHEARQQDLLELIVTYYVLASVQDPLSKDQLKSGVERLLKELLAIDIRFDPDPTVDRLEVLGIAIEDGFDRLTVLSTKGTLEQLDCYWDNLMTTGRQATP